MSTKRIHITASIKIKHMFRCDRCGKEQEGDTAHYSFAGSDEYNIQRIIRDSTPDPRDMPVGWHSYYGKTRTHFNCGCRKNNAGE